MKRILNNDQQVGGTSGDRLKYKLKSIPGRLSIIWKILSGKDFVTVMRVRNGVQTIVSFGGTEPVVALQVSESLEEVNRHIIGTLKQVPFDVLEELIEGVTSTEKARELKDYAKRAVKEE